MNDRLSIWSTLGRKGLTRALSIFRGDAGNSGNGKAIEAWTPTVVRAFDPLIMNVDSLQGKHGSNGANFDDNKITLPSGSSNSLATGDWPRPIVATGTGILIKVTGRRSGIQLGISFLSDDGQSEIIFARIGKPEADTHNLMALASDINAGIELDDWMDISLADPALDGVSDEYLGVVLYRPNLHPDKLAVAMFYRDASVVIPINDSQSNPLLIDDADAFLSTYTRIGIFAAVGVSGGTPISFDIMEDNEVDAWQAMRFNNGALEIPEESITDDLIGKVLHVTLDEEVPYGGGYLQNDMMVMFNSDREVIRSHTRGTGEW